VSDDGTESSEIKPAKKDSDDEIDESLWDIVNSKKLRSEPLIPPAEDSLESADSSGRFRARKSVGDGFKPRNTATRPSHILSLPKRSLPKPRTRTRAPLPPPESDDDSSDYSSSEDDDPRQKLVVDPLEEITIRAVRKGKLLSRIKQMEAKGVRPSKTFTLKSSDEEMMVEVARMEVMAERSVRITQGRSMLLTATKTLESGANVVDRKNYLPMKFNLKGFTDALLTKIDEYDDCLERGVAETIGPASSRIWWVEMLYILLPSMFMFSLGNNGNAKDKKSDPEYQQMLAREYAREMGQAERKKNAELLKRLQKAEEENAKLKNDAVTMMPPPPSAPRTAPVERPKSTGPTPTPIRSEHPLGDLPVNPAETAKMQTLISKQQQKKPVVKPRILPPSQRSGKVLDLSDSSSDSE